MSDDVLGAFVRRHLERCLWVNAKPHPFQHPFTPKEWADADALRRRREAEEQETRGASDA